MTKKTTYSSFDDLPSFIEDEFNQLQFVEEENNADVSSENCANNFWTFKILNNGNTICFCSDQKNKIDNTALQEHNHNSIRPPIPQTAYAVTAEQLNDVLKLSEKSEKSSNDLLDSIHELTTDNWIKIRRLLLNRSIASHDAATKLLRNDFIFSYVADEKFSNKIFNNIPFPDSGTYTVFVFGTFPLKKNCIQIAYNDFVTPVIHSFRQKDLAVNKSFHFKKIISFPKRINNISITLNIPMKKDQWVLLVFHRMKPLL